MKDNDKAIYDYLKENGPRYKNEIANALDMHTSSVSRSVERMVDNDILKEKIAILGRMNNRPMTVYEVIE